METPEVPEELVLSREMYAVGSFGQEYFPNVLEGRTRPNIFVACHTTFGPKTDIALRERGIHTLHDLLSLSPTELTDLPKHMQTRITGQLPYEVERVAERALITPHGLLLSALLGGPRGPVEPADEPLLAHAVEHALGQLDEKYQPTVRLRFGLDDGVRRTLEDVGEHFGVTRERVRQIESKALAQLRHPHRSTELRRFQAVPQHSIGRLLGITYKVDIPQIPVTIAELGLSDEAMTDLDENCYGFRTACDNQQEDEDRDEQRIADDFVKLLSASFDSRLKDDTKTELVDKIGRTVREQGEPYIVFGDLLPEVSVPYGKTGVIRDTLVAHMNLSVDAERMLRKNDQVTLGSLLHIERDDNGRVDSIDLNTAREVGTVASKLVFYLEAMTQQLHEIETTSAPQFAGLTREDFVAGGHTGSVGTSWANLLKFIDREKDFPLRITSYDELDGDLDTAVAWLLDNRPEAMVNAYAQRLLQLKTDAQDAKS